MRQYIRYIRYFLALLPFIFLSCRESEVPNLPKFNYTKIDTIHNDSSTKFLNNYGIILWERGNYQKSLQNFSKAYRLSEKMKDNKMMAQILNNMGLVHWSLENYKDAMECYGEAGRLAGQLGMKEVEGLALLNQSLILKERKEYPEAHRHIDRAIAILTEVDIPRHMGICYNNKGQIYKEQKELDSARYYYEKAITVYKIVDYKNGMSATYNNLADISTGHNKPVAFDAAYKSLALALKDKSKVRISESYLRLAEVYEHYNEIDSALKYQKRYSNFQIDFLTAGHTEKLAEYQADMGVEVKNLRIENLEKQEIITSAKVWKYSGLIFIAMLIISFFIYRKLTIETHNKKQLKLDLANSFNVIQLQERELRSYILNLARKHNRLTSLQDKISKEISMEEQDAQIAQLLSQKILTEEDWSTFKAKFNIIYPLFFSRVKQLNIGLTEAETRFLVLFRLRLKGKEMSNTLGISLQSVRACKMRLRKKLMANGYGSVEDFMSMM